VTVLTEAGLVQRTLTIQTKLDKDASEAQRIERLIYIANELVGIVKEFRIVDLGVEDYAYAAGYSAHQIGEIGGTIKTQIWLACGVVVRPAPIKSARKHVIGYGGSLGKTSKEAKANTVHIVREGYGVDVANDHEADSFVVARYTFDKVVAEAKEAQELWEKQEI
jgi:hypothetical protein